MNTINTLDKILEKNTKMKSLRWELSLFSFRLTNCPNTCLNGEHTVRNSPKFWLQIELNHGQQRRTHLTWAINWAVRNPLTFGRTCQMAVFAPSNRVMVDAFLKNLPPKKSSFWKKSSKNPPSYGRSPKTQNFAPCYEANLYP